MMEAAVLGRNPLVDLSRSKLDEKLWEQVSLYVRMSSANSDGICECYTCGKKVFWKYGDAGHCFSRTYTAIKFIPDNLRFQCKQCNGPRGGMHTEFRLNLIEEIGLSAVMELEARRNDEFKPPIEWWVEQITWHKAEVGILRLRVPQML